MALTAAQIQTAYQNVLQRAASPAEEKAWVNVSTSGALTDAQIIASIVNSPEAINYTAATIRIYQAAFGRVPDKAGLDVNTDVLSAGAPVNALAGAFVMSQEFANKYNGGVLVQDNAAAVTDAFLQSLYVNVLGRTGSAAEIQAWKAALTTPGSGYTKASDVLVGFSQSAEFVQKTAPAIQTFLTAAANGTAVYSGSLLDTGGVPDASFAFTAGIDNLTGTNGNDTFIGDNSTATATVQVGDQINGGNGTDTLKLYAVATGTVFPQINSIERLYLNATTGGLDVSTKTGVTALEVENIAAAQTFTVGANQSVTMTNVANGGTTTIAGNAPSSLNLTLNKVGTSLANDTVALSGTALATANVTATNNSFVTLTNAGGALKTLNVDGTGVLKLDTAVTTITTIDASKSTGGINVNSIGASNLTFTGSAKADTLSLAGTLTTADVLNGGDGTDTLGVTVGSTLVAGLQVSNFETLDVGGGNAAGGAALANAYDVSRISGITTLKVGSAINADAGTNDVTTINNLAKGAGVEIGASLGTGAGDQLVINVKDAGVASPNDTITVTLNAAAALNTGGDLVINDIETVNLNVTSSGTSITHTLSNMTAAQATSVTVNASTAALTVDNLQTLALVNFDASASVKAVSVTTGADAFTAASGVGFKLGQGDDTIVLTGATTAAAADNNLDFRITGGKGQDTITLAAAVGGQDQVVITAASDSTNAKWDIVNNFSATAGPSAIDDKIDVKAFAFAAAAQSVKTIAGGVTIGATITVDAASSAGFFIDSGTARGVAEFEFGGDTYVFIDANKDGNFTAADDAVLRLVGVTAANFEADNVLFA